MGHSRDQHGEPVHGRRARLRSSAFHLPATQSTFGAGLNINRCNCPLTQDENQYQVVNNWTLIKGNHSIKIGADLRWAHNLRVPSDTDRAGHVHRRKWSDFRQRHQRPGLGNLCCLANSTRFGRYVSTSTDAKEYQPRYFFYGQDTWRVTHALTLNLGLRYELYFPESVNAAGNGSLMKLSDGYMHVAGIGGIGSNMGWSISYGKMFDPRIGVAYQLNDKTVIRGGYGRSFDTGVFGSIFGHVVTQNLPVLANQSLQFQVEPRVRCRSPSRKDRRRSCSRRFLKTDSCRRRPTRSRPRLAPTRCTSRPSTHGTSPCSAPSIPPST